MAAIGSSWASGSWVSVGGWAAGTWADAGSGLPFHLDLNERVYVFLCDHYSVSSGDLTTMTNRYLNSLTTGDRTQKMQQLITNATNAT